MSNPKENIRVLILAADGSFIPSSIGHLAFVAFHTNSVIECHTSPIVGDYVKLVPRDDSE